MSLLHLEPLPPRATKADVLRFVSEQGGLDRRLVGRIDLQGRTATVEVPDTWEGRLLKALDGAVLNDRRLRAWSGGGRAAGQGDHFQRLAELLELESHAEAEQVRERGRRRTGAEAEQSGDCLVDLVVREEYAGLGGRFILALGKRDRSRPLPWTRLQAGTPVLLSPQGGGGQGWRGVVCERAGGFLRVAFNDAPEEDGDRAVYRLDLAPDEAARLRQRQALERARGARGDRLAELRAVLLGEAAPSFGPLPDYTPLDPALNESQREAVRFALAAPDPARIHGPPGTGKTTTVVELIRQAVRRGDKVLVCAPSNLAVDNLLERLLAHGEQAVRLGHPARVLPQLRDNTLDVMVDNHSDVKLARQFAKGEFALFRQAKEWTGAQPE